MCTLHHEYCFDEIKYVWHEASMEVMDAFRILLRIPTRKDITIPVKEIGCVLDSLA
jgi:hypothetical protein